LNVPARKLDVLLQPRKLCGIERVRVTVGPSTRNDGLRIQLPRRYCAVVLLESISQLPKLPFYREHLAVPRPVDDASPDEDE